jgi:hypothetical protein
MFQGSGETWDLRPGKNSPENPFKHHTQLSQIKERETFTYTMAQLTRQIPDATGRHKTAAQGAQIKSNQCKSSGHHHHTLIRLCNPQLTQQSLLYASEKQKHKGPNPGT